MGKFFGGVALNGSSVAAHDTENRNKKDDTEHDTTRNKSSGVVLYFGITFWRVWRKYIVDAVCAYTCVHGASG